MIYEDRVIMSCCQDDILTESIWFVCSKTSCSGDVTDAGQTNNNKQGKIEQLSLWTAGRLGCTIIRILQTVYFCEIQECMIVHIVISFRVVSEKAFNVHMSLEVQD